VINKIFEDNLETIRSVNKLKSEVEIDQNHFNLFATINQLHDLLQYLEFKEPQADIINKLGASLRFYLAQKRGFPSPYFRIGHTIKNDISFRILTEEYAQIESDKTFYEQKILRIFSSSYLLFLKDSHYELASLCGNELFETGKTAVEFKDDRVTDVVLIYFNTMVRFGINDGIKNREIKNVYNTIFHYSQFLNIFVKNRREDKILECCRYFSFYAQEIQKMTLSEPMFFFLVEAFSVELKKILISMHDSSFPRHLQVEVLTMFNELSTEELKRPFEQQHVNHRGLLLIQVALCLFYLKNDEIEFHELTIDSMIHDMEGLGENEIMGVIATVCDKLEQTREDFWEETDQGRRNIYYSPDRKELPKFISHMSKKVLEKNTVVSV
jgi:hypothetical protein